MITDRFPDLFPYRLVIILALLPIAVLPAQKRIAGNDGFRQQYLVQAITIENGLSDNTINAIIQDKHGFLWIGTEDGLNKYDGYQFTIYKHQPGNPASLSHNTIRAILEDHAGYLWVATTDGLNRFDPRTESFTSFHHDPSVENSISHNDIYALYEDSDSTIWVGAYNGLNRFDHQSQSFKLFQHRETYNQIPQMVPNWINVIEENKDGQLLVGYWGMGLMLFDREQRRFSRTASAFRPPNWINTIETKGGDSIWIATGSFFKYTEPKGFIRIRPDLFPLIHQNVVHSLLKSSSGLFLVGTQGSGLYILNETQQVIQHFLPGGQSEGSLKDNWIYTMYEDQAGEIWLGTGGGLFHLDPKGNQFVNYPHPLGKTIPQDHYVRSLLEVESGSIWVGSKENGISIFDQKNNTSYSFPLNAPHPEGLKSNAIACLYQSQNGHIWIGAWGAGLHRYRPDTETFDYFSYDPGNDQSIPEDFVSTILETRQGEIWVGTTGGLAVLRTPDDIQTKTFTRYHFDLSDPLNLNSSYIKCMAQTKSGAVWVGTLGDGLKLFDRKTNAFISFKHNPNDPASISSNQITAIFEDSKDRLWIGTSSDLDRFDPDSESFIHYTETDGLKNGFVSRMQEDDNGYIWLSSKKGLSKFDPGNGQFKHFNAKEGLFNGNFEANAFILSRYNGALLAGGKNGLSVFHPDSIRDNIFIPPVVISSLKKYSRQEGMTKEVDVKGIAELKEIELSYQDNIIAFEFAALNFRNPQKNQYAYQLEGFNDTWISLGTKREVTFTNLDPGSYILRVKGSNNDGVWNEEPTTLRITVTPPWWATNWAYAIYLTAFLGLLFLINRFSLRRQELKHQLQSEKEEALRLKELDTFKSRLYTNLTHEFRTPLTVILGMVRQIKDQPQKYLDSGLQMVERNGQNLLRLINQLLDLSKLENQAFPLNLQQSDIIPLLRYLTESFQSYANNQNLAVRFDTTLQELVMDHDPVQIRQILTNLISNALKFTPSGGEIRIRAGREHDHLLLSVKDTGIGIAPGALPYIFDRFYQVDPSSPQQEQTGSLSIRPEGGTGIGLAHTLELVKLMDGEISVESQLGLGTTFEVVLPIRRTAPRADVPVEERPFDWNIIADAPPDSSDRPGDGRSPSEMPALLIIEDNPDVVTYLKACLQDSYALDVAYNGRIGIEKALQQIPDLIVSDVMMPEKDGYEVCDTLKNDERTSHIPIVLLTAKADAASRLAGLKRGADAYLAKPFDREELLVRLEKLLALRKRMIEYFSRAASATPSPAPVSPEEAETLQTEDAFVQKIDRIIEENIADEDFGLPQLCQRVRMSRSQLFRKLKALTGDAPSNYIRAYRLHRAKMLLETTELNVSEVAWAVGYKHVAHFSRSFQEFFDAPPSQIKRSETDDSKEWTNG